MNPAARPPRTRLALVALAVLASVLMPVASSGAHSDGQPDPTATPATDPCEEGFELDDDGQCTKTETESAEAACPAAIQNRAVSPSGDGCVTTAPHTMSPTYTCTTANAGNPEVRYALAGDPPECQRRVEREETTTTTVTDMVHFMETYQHRVPPLTEQVRVPPLTRTYMGMESYTYTVQVRVAPFTETERVSYVVQVQESYVVQVRVPPTSETVRVAPFSETITGTRQRTESYCAQYDVEFGTGCIRWATRTVTETYTEVVEAFNYETRPVFNYESEVRFRYVSETRYRNVTRNVYNYRTETRTGMRETLITEPAFHYEDRDVFNYEPRERLVCCRPETREVTTTRTVTRTESATPDASCTAAGYSVNPASVCEHPAGVRLGDATYECDTGWTAVEDDETECERTLTESPAWDCPAAPRHTLDTSTSPPHCHVAQGVCPPERLGSLGSGSTERQQSWGSGCRSERRGSEQSPHWARSWSFALGDPASVSVSVESGHNAVIYVIDAATGVVVASGSAIGSVRLEAGSYVIEVTTTTARAAGEFTVTVDVSAAPRVAISGLSDDAESPRLGATVATVSSGFVVAPADAACSATPAGAIVSPATGGSRTVSHAVPEGTTVAVTVTCSSGAHSASASAQFTANDAPVRISGLTDASEQVAAGAAGAVVSGEFEVVPAGARCGATRPAGATVAPVVGATARTVTVSLDGGESEAVTVRCDNGTEFDTATAIFEAVANLAVSGLDDTTETPVVGDDSVTVADRITVTPAEATCAATPAGATVTVGGLPSGTARWVSLDVPADSTVTVTVTCSHGEASAAASANFTANPAPEAGECDDPLGTLRGASVSRAGRLDSSTGCRSLGRYGSRGSASHYAGRHTFTVTAAGWVTIDLEATSRGRDWIDAYLVLMNGADPDGGVVLERNDDSGSGFNSRIVRRYLQPGRYTIEATTYSRRDSGRYRLTVVADYRPQAPVHPAHLRVRNGTTVTSTWGYRPATAAVAMASVFPDGIDASVSASAGTATLTATPSRVGQYAVLVSYANGPASFTRTTTIDSYCPNGQEEIPGDCATPLTALEHEHHVSIVPQPLGYGPPDGTNSCIKDVTTDGTAWYTCRRVQDLTTYISKADPRISATSGPITVNSSNHGVTLMLRSGVFLETCQSITSATWQCGHRSDKFWQRAAAGATFTNYIFPALYSGVIVPGRCALSLVSLRVISRGNPQAYAAAINTCSGIAAPVTS